MTEPIVERLRVYSDFLNGSSQMDDIWFGDQHPSKRGAFWWRNDLPLTDAADTITDLLELLIAADQVIVWEHHGLGRDFSDKLEDAIARARGGAA
jgi:hypothetical protein